MFFCYLVGVVGCLFAGLMYNNGQDHRGSNKSNDEQGDFQRVAGCFCMLHGMVSIDSFIRSHYHGCVFRQ